MPASSEDRIAVLAHQFGRYLVGTWRRVHIVYWMRQGTPDVVEEVRAALELAYGLDPGATCSIIHIIRDGAGLPDPAVRAAVLAMSSHFAPRTACLGVVLLGSGFWASAMQSVLTALRFVAPRRSALMKFSRDVAELGTWFPTEHNMRTGDQVGSEQLDRVLDEMFRIAADGAAASA